jgi:type II secretion system (T2SS) protein M
VSALGTWLAGLGARERALLGVAAGLLGVVLAFRATLAVRDDLTVLRARVAAHERELADVRRAAATLRRSRTPAPASDSGSLLTRVESAALGTVGRERIAGMTPAAGSVEDGLAEERVALRVTNTALPDAVGLLHALETASPPLSVARLELRKHPDDPARFDVTVEVTTLRPAS